MEKPLVMLAEDDDDVRFALAESLRRSGHEVIAVPDGERVRQYIDQCVFSDAFCPRVHMLITDLRMPGLNGLQLLSYLRDLDWDLPAIVITAFGSEEVEQRARAFGACAILDKPIDLDRLEAAMRDVLAQA
ncbi:MAG TPA: response regulator [Polyangiales bacterium]|jgi:CheY-like chemotaxis protein|nr:response regulator [Polyangiales bacterium]